MNRVLKILRILAGLVEIVLGLVVVLVAVMLFMLAEAFASTASSEHVAITLQEATAGERAVSTPAPRVRQP